MTDKIKYYYHPDKNPLNIFYPDMAMADITEEQWKSMSKPKQSAVKKAPFWSTKPVTDTAVILDEPAVEEHKTVVKSKED